MARESREREFYENVSFYPKWEKSDRFPTRVATFSNPNTLAAHSKEKNSSIHYRIVTDLGHFWALRIE